MPTAAGSLIGGKYRVDHVIREGNVCIVIAARHKHLGTPVAIKVLRAEHADNIDGVARFVREGQLAALLKNEHVVRIYDVGVSERFPYIAMELLEGHDVAHEIAVSAWMAEVPAVTWILDACEAVAEAHAMGIVHRDIKPSNLFVTRASDGSPFIKVLDFGIASASNAPGDVRMTSTTDVMGTPLYMSPEVMESARRADARSDIWALGATLYEMLTGHAPFLGENVVEVYAATMRGGPKPLREHRASISEGVEAVVLQCLARAPADRFECVAEFVDALGHAALPSAVADSRTVRVARIAAEAASRSKQAMATVQSGSREVDTYGPASWRVAARSRRARQNALGVAIIASAAILAAVVALLVSRSSGTPVSNSTVANAPASAELTTSSPVPMAAGAASIAPQVAMPSALSSEAAMPSDAPSASADGRPPVRPKGPWFPPRSRESDFATDPHR